MGKGDGGTGEGLGDGGGAFLCVGEVVEDAIGEVGFLVGVEIAGSYGVECGLFFFDRCAFAAKGVSKGHSLFSDEGNEGEIFVEEINGVTERDLKGIEFWGGDV